MTCFAWTWVCGTSVTVLPLKEWDIARWWPVSWVRCTSQTALNFLRACSCSLLVMHLQKMVRNMSFYPHVAMLAKHYGVIRAFIGHLSVIYVLQPFRLKIPSSLKISVEIGSHLQTHASFTIWLMHASFNTTSCATLPLLTENINAQFDCFCSRFCSSFDKTKNEILCSQLSWSLGFQCNAAQVAKDVRTFTAAWIYSKITMAIESMSSKVNTVEKDDMWWFSDPWNCAQSPPWNVSCVVFAQEFFWRMTIFFYGMTQKLS